MRLRRPATTLAALGLLLAIAGCNPLSNSGPGSSGGVVTVAVVPGIDNATFALALHGGMFSSAGIDVRMRSYSTAAAALAALGSGAVQVAAVDYGDLFFAEATSSPIYKILADGYDAAPGILEIMTLPDSPISSPANLADHQIGIPNVDQLRTTAGAPISLAEASATSVLQNYGVNLTTIGWQPMSPQAEITALKRKKVAAVLLAEPYIDQAEQIGATQLVDAYSGSTAGIPLSGYVTTKAWYQEHPSSATAFRSAIERAAAVASMPGPVQQILPGYAHLSKQEAALVTIGSYPTTTIAASLQRTANLMAVEGMIRFGLNVAAMIIRLAGITCGRRTGLAVCVREPWSVRAAGR
jgi:NitT/TauT family transport system substrate-binding protein